MISQGFIAGLLGFLVSDIQRFQVQGIKGVRVILRPPGLGHKEGMYGLGYWGG